MVPACRRFSDFLDQYIKDKMDILTHEVQLASEELHHTKLATYAPFAYVRNPCLSVFQC